MTWNELISIEPALYRLYLEASAPQETDDPSFCANAVWADRFKPRLLRLVGWDAMRPALRTEAAYDLACDNLYAALPDCRSCDCVCVG